MNVDQIVQRYRMEHVQDDQFEEGKRMNRLFGLRDLIQENLNANSIICEIGSFRGASADLFAALCKIVYCVDVFDAKIAGIDYEAQFDATMHRHNNIFKIVGRSVEVAPLFDNEFFDLIYIDAQHEYEPVKADIIAWLPKIKKGGFISGHDYISKIGVPRAVQEVLGIPNKIYEDSSWLVKC